jgi:hypothetical protein
MMSMSRSINADFVIKPHWLVRLAADFQDRARDAVFALGRLVRIVFTPMISYRSDIPAWTAPPAEDRRVVFAKIRVSKSIPGESPRYPWLGRAKQLWATTPFAMKSSVPVVMSKRRMARPIGSTDATRSFARSP